MALSVEKLLTDAHTLIIHLKDHDSLADNIIASTQALYNKVEAMKQYQDDITELNEIAKHRPRSTLVLGIAQENRQIRELQQENRELQATLEEHQSALELIMQKYREHTVKLLHSNRIERALHDKDVTDKDSMCHLMDKIDEMAGVMQKAIEVDETVGCVDKERVSRLEVENRALREMLEICTTSRDRIMVPFDPLGLQEAGAIGELDNILGDEDDDDDDDDTDTECDSTILVSDMCYIKNPVDEKVDKPEEKNSEKEEEKSEEKKIENEEKTPIKEEKPEKEEKVEKKEEKKEEMEMKTEKKEEKIEKKEEKAEKKEGKTEKKEEKTEEKGVSSGKKKATDNVSKENPTTPSSSATAAASPARKGAKSPSPSKSPGDLKKSKSGTTVRSTTDTSTVKKSSSVSSVKKDTSSQKRSPPVESKKDVKSNKPGSGKGGANKK